MTQNQDVLIEYLKPLHPYLRDPFISEISINEPGLLFIEKEGSMVKQVVPELTFYHLRGLVDLIARYHGQLLNEDSPLLSGTLPSGHRIQIVIPPACEAHKVIISLRKSLTSHVTLIDFENSGAFALTQACSLDNIPKKPSSHCDNYLFDLFQKKEYGTFLKQAVLDKKNIIVAGQTSSGKTTLLNACLEAIPSQERIITLEDVREIHMTQSNVVHLLASHVSLQRLVEVALRLRPDRIIIGEIRGSEVIDFCHANQTGHSGTIASIHADHPAQVFDRLVQLVRRYSNSSLTRDDILLDWYNLVDVIVQMERRNNQRVIAQIYFSCAQQ